MSIISKIPTRASLTEAERVMPSQSKGWMTEDS